MASLLASFAQAGFAESPGSSNDVRLHDQQQRDVAIRGVHDLRVSSQVIARLADEAVSGYAPSFDSLALQRNSIEKAFEDIGNTQDLSSCASFDEVKLVWSRTRKDVDSIIGSRSSVLAASEASDQFIRAASRLEMAIDSLVRVMLEKGSSPSQLVVATRLQVLAGRMGRRMYEIRYGNDHQAVLERDLLFSERIIEGFRAGDEELGVLRLSNETMASLDPALTSLQQARRIHDELKSVLPVAFRAMSSSEVVSAEAVIFLEQADRFADDVASSGESGACSIH